MKPRIYSAPAAFKAALDQRLRNAAEPAIGISRRRQLLVFDRYLARVVRVLGNAVTLKGGLVLELRLERARTTKDVDLRIVGSPEGLLLRLQEAGRLDLGDFMSFEIALDPEHPGITGEGARYDGQRFRAECRIAGKRFGDPFGVDVGVGDPILGEPEIMRGDDLLEFAGIPAPELRVYPVESHIAEKLHAYTMPRPTPNSRVKDLPDLALLGLTGTREARRLRAALDQTFTFRNTHPVPRSVPDPPEEWTPKYASIAVEDELPWHTLADVAAAARAFLDPVLGAEVDARWNPETWAWSPVR
jgi:nucleotidyltransferase AbiEii toxin of type IV toxin-antitoxin system